MRTTVSIDDDVLAVARALAAQQGVSLGHAVSELARRGFMSTPRTGADDTVFAVPDNAKTFTSEDVYRALSEWP